MNDVDIMVSSVMSSKIRKYKYDDKEDFRAGVEHICRLVHGGIILYNLRELSQKLSESYIKAQTPSTSQWNREFSYGVMVACEYCLGIEKNGGDK